jgi:hypothetical protein
MCWYMSAIIAAACIPMVSGWHLAWSAERYRVFSMLGWSKQGQPWRCFAVQRHGGDARCGGASGV